MAADGRHSTQTSNHILENWTYADATTRAAASGFVAADIGKVAYQTDTGVYYRLTATTPTWVAIGASGSVADPSGTVGLVAVNGSASTAIRSDGAPALSQAIAPTWTGVHTFTPGARSSGVAPYLTVNAPADTSLTTLTEAIGVSFVGAIRQHATGAIATQREYVFGAPTYSAVGASTITTAATLVVTGAPINGTNITITNPLALLCQAGSSLGAKTAVFQAGSSTPGNIISLQNSSGTDLIHFDSAGNLIPTANNAIQIGSATLAILRITANQVYSANGDILTFGTNGNSRWSIGATGNFIPDNDAGTDIASSGTRLRTVYATQGQFLNNTAGNITVIAKAAASRTVQLQQFQTSAGGSLGNVSGGCIGDVFADVSTTHTDGTFDTLRTDTTVANALIVNGDKIYFDYTLTTVSSVTAARDFKLVFAGITIFDSTGLVFGSGAGSIRITGYIIRKTSTTARATIDFRASGNATIQAFSGVTYVPDSTLTGLTLTGTNALVLSAAASGTGAASADISLVSATIHIDGFGS